MRIVVIGAAPTGLGVAYRLNELQQSGNDKAKNIELIVLEKQSYAGGLSCTITDEKGFLWDMGTHVTFSHNFPYYDDAVKWAVDEWNHLTRNCQVDMNRMFNEEGLHLVPYPAQYSVPLFPKEIKASCLKELKERHEMEHIEAPNNFDEWTLSHFGPTIRHYFFRPYTRKLWTVETDEMNSVWVGTRVAKLPQTKLEELCAMSKQELANADFGWGPNVVFTYPKYGGTGAIWNAMAAKLSQKWFRFNCEVTKVNAKDKRLTYVKKEENGNEQTNVIDYDILINSSPIDLLVKNLNLRIELNLQHNKVYIVGVGMKLPMPEFIKSFSWLYFPDPAVPFYRVTVFSNYGEVTPDNAKYWSLICECATNPSDPTTKEEMGKLAVNGLIKKSFIERQQIVSIYSTVLDYGYPIPSLKRDSELARAHKILEEHDIYSRGRFGGWKYEASNQDHCFIQGKELVDRIILNESERLYKTGLPYK